MRYEYAEKYYCAKAVVGMDFFEFFSISARHTGLFIQLIAAHLDLFFLGINSSNDLLPTEVLAWSFLSLFQMWSALLWGSVLELYVNSVISPSASISNKRCMQEYTLFIV